MDGLDWTVSTFLSGRFWCGIGGGVILAIGIHRFLTRKEYRVSQVGLNLPFGLGNVTYEATDRDRVLAWKLYVQLKTRKAALIFDEQNDVIAEVYDSLYEIFPITRDLLTSIPLHEAEKRDGIVDLTLRVLNDGLRPHLTKWSASYRRWWEEALRQPANNNKPPQDIQKLYPQYVDLVRELKAMNTELSKYSEDLLAIVQAPHGRKTMKPVPVVTPEQPQPTTLPVAQIQEPVPPLPQRTELSDPEEGKDA